LLYDYFVNTLKGKGSGESELDSLLKD
jgi:hypothetical protein